MSKNVRPGCVDYSKFDAMDFSDDSDDEHERREREERYAVLDQQDRRRRGRDDDDDDVDEEDSDFIAGSDGDSYDEEEDESYYSEEEEEGSYDDEESGEEDEESGGEDEESEDEQRWQQQTQTTRRVDPPPRPRPEATLSQLKQAWFPGTTVDDKGNVGRGEESGGSDDDDEDVGDQKPASSAVDRYCANCHRASPPYRCSRCKLVWFCGVGCQRAYQPIHKKECVDADKHMAYWGWLDKDSKKAKHEAEGNAADAPKPSKEEERAALRRALESRLQLRRRRALKLAAAAEAVRRARMAREARGHQKAGPGGAKGKGMDEREEECSICMCEFTVRGDSGVGLRCPSSHFMCSECTGVYVKSVLGDLQTSYPPRCSICRGDFPTDQFDSQLNSKQQAHVRAFAAQRALKPGQCIVKCPSCEHFEVQKVPGDCLWWCACCGVGTCFVCNASLSGSIRKYDIEKSPHAICKKLRSAKKMIEDAIEDGSKMKCPCCGLAGRKDDACTHMNCPRCAASWCYVCGLNAKDCDKAPPRNGAEPSIYDHNREWETNEARCPMYLTQILEVDLNWLSEGWEERLQDAELDWEDDDKCLDYLHRFKTIQALQKARDEIGLENFVACFVHFDALKNCGYTIDEVMSTDTTHLIDRSEYLQYRENEEDGDQGGAPGEDARDGLQINDIIEGFGQAGAQAQAEAQGNGAAAAFGEALLATVEGEQIRRAVEASEASAQEDEQLRVAIEDSRNL